MKVVLINDQDADNNTEADRYVCHEGEQPVDGQAAHHSDAVDVVEVDLTTQQQQRTEGKTKGLK